jgi:hypothetical protein
MQKGTGESFEFRALPTRKAGAVSRLDGDDRGGGGRGPAKAEEERGGVGAAAGGGVVRASRRTEASVGGCD